jgi:hypothetical protein
MSEKINPDDLLKKVDEIVNKAIAKHLAEMSRQYTPQEINIKFTKNWILVFLPNGYLKISKKLSEGQYKLKILQYKEKK